MGLNTCTLILGIASLGMLAAGCGDGGNTPVDDGGDAADAAETRDGDEVGVLVHDGCEALMLYCITDSHFDDLAGLGITDTASAEAAFRCMLELYTGDCRTQLGDILACLEPVTDASQCTPCDQAFGDFMHACPSPLPCAP